MNKRVLVGLTIIMILFSPLASSESSDEFTVNNTEPEMTTGDYFLYELDISGLLNSMQDEDIDEVRENSNSGMRLEYGGDSCLLTDWSDCGIGLTTWELNLTMVFSNGSGIDNDQAIMLMKMESTYVWTNPEMKSEDTTVQTMDMWFTIDGEAYHSETVSTEVSITSTENSEPEFVKSGDTWSVLESVKTTINEKSREDGQWEHEDEVIEYQNITTNYNAESISNVYIGNTSYQTLKIKSEELGSDEMGYTYLTDNGMPVKMEYYENGSLQMIGTLTDYSWTNEPTQTSENNAIADDELPGFTLVPALLASVFAVFIINRNE